MSRFLDSAESILKYFESLNEPNKINVLTEIEPSQYNTNFKGEFEVNLIYHSIDTTGKSEICEHTSIKTSLNPQWFIENDSDFRDRMNYLLDSVSSFNFGCKRNEETKLLEIADEDYYTFNTALIGTQRYAELLRREIKFHKK